MNQSSRQLFQKLLRFAWPHRVRIGISMVASLGVAGSDAAIAKLVQPFIDKLIVAGDRQMVILVPFLVIGLALFKGGARYVQEYCIKTAGQLVIQKIRNLFYCHTVDLSMRFFGRSQTGNLISRILNDVAVMQSTVSQVLVEVLREGLTLVALVGVAFYTDWKMATIAFVVLPAAGLPAALIGQRIKAYSRRGQTVMGLLTTVLEQTFSGIKVIKAFGTEEYEKQRFVRANRQFYEFFRKVIKYDSGSSPIIEVLSALGVAGVLWFGLERVMAGEMSQGELFSVLAAVLMMYSPLKKLTRTYNQIQQAMGAAERVFEVLEEEPDIRDRADAVDAGRLKGEVRFDQVHFAYEGEPVLSDVTISASPGEVVALVGPSGAGKSTIAGLLCRFYEVGRGAILVDGHDVNRLTGACLHRNIAMVDQETFLFNDTIGNNIRYGCWDATDEQVAEAARRAFADEFIRQLPDGYDTVIGDRGLRLSGGQRQRLCIARALLRDAPILILDEATSALDTESEAVVQQALVNLMEQRTTFVIAHRLSTIMHAHQIVVLDQGRVVERGSHETLLAADGLYRRLYEMQFKE